MDEVLLVRCLRKRDGRDHRERPSRQHRTAMLPEEAIESFHRG